MASVGRKVTWPKAKDKTKTYMWRSMKSFITRSREASINDAMIPHMVRSVVKHAKENGLLNRSASLLMKRDLFDICFRKLQQELSDERALIDGVRRSALFLEKKLDENNKTNVLLIRKHPDAFANITMWLQAGQITESFIAISKRCGKALSKLDESERSQFPSDILIIKARCKYLHRDNLCAELREIMKSDLATRGV